MPPLTIDALVASNRNVRKQKTESNEQYLARLTHVSVTGQNITKLDHLQLCPAVTSLYLYDNLLTQIEQLSACTRLTHLYLQHNNITRIAGLGRLRSLTKLHLGYNSIAVVEGLESLTNLRELHLEHQSLPPGEELVFDPRSLAAIAGSLAVLNIAGNHLTSLQPIASSLFFITIADLSHNRIADLSQVLSFTDANTDLTRLAIEGNPCCEMSKHREEIIVRTNALQLLDGREIAAPYRQFLRQWKLALATKHTRPHLHVALERQAHSAGPTVAPIQRLGFAGSLRKPPRNLPPLDRRAYSASLGADL